MRIQLIEDHERLAALIRKGLKTAGFSVDALARGEDALSALDCVHYDAVVLDLGLPDQDGLSVLRKLRNGGQTIPVLILTSRVLVANRVEGLDAGADDYMVKPFAMEELVARLRALLRRPSAALGPLLEIGKLTFDTVARDVRVGETPVSLSKREIQVLEQLVRRANRAVPKSLIEDSMFGFGDDLSSNFVEVLIHRLRKKLEEAGAGVRIETVRGVGYTLTAEPT